MCCVLGVELEVFCLLVVCFICGLYDVFVVIDKLECEFGEVCE